MNEAQVNGTQEDEAVVDGAQEDEAVTTRWTTTRWRAATGAMGRTWRSCGGSG